MNTAVNSFLSLAVFFGLSLGAEQKDARTQNKNITVITAGSQADGGSEISRETIKECILSLPTPAALEPEVKSESRYLREINGDPGKNEWMKAYTARITIRYMLYRKELLIVTIRSVAGKEPVMKEIEKRLPQSQEFVSNPDDGAIYAGRSDRQYYFTKAEDAANDAKARATVWLKQQAPVVCEEK